MDYYQYVQRAFDDGNLLIAVLGTPGIGKSFFFSYFLDRFREENEDITIVTASYTTDRMLKHCRVFLPGSIVGSFSHHVPEHRHALCLFEGAPAVAPENARMVLFTSANSSW
jgi:hypothetical protein